MSGYYKYFASYIPENPFKGWSQKEQPSKCDVCQKQVTDSKTFICQHNFCESCLNENIKVFNEETCPTCSAESQCQSHKKDRIYKLCSICDKEEGCWSCEDCDQSLCSTCLNNHNNYKLFINHKVTESKEEEPKFKSSDKFYCLDCKKVFELELRNLHANHKVKTENEFIEQKIIKLKKEIDVINALEVLEKNKLSVGKKAWREKETEILGFNDQVKKNYQELTIFLQTKEQSDYQKIDYDLLYVKKFFLKHQGLVKKDILSLHESRSNIESKMKEIKNSFTKDFKDTPQYQQPQMHPQPLLKHHLSFNAIPMTALSQLPSSIVNTENIKTG